MSGRSRDNGYDNNIALVVVIFYDVTRGDLCDGRTAGIDKASPERDVGRGQACPDGHNNDDYYDDNHNNNKSKPKKLQV